MPTARYRRRAAKPRRRCRRSPGERRRRDRRPRATPYLEICHGSRAPRIPSSAHRASVAAPTQPRRAAPRARWPRSASSSVASLVTLFPSARDAKLPLLVDPPPHEAKTHFPEGTPIFVRAPSARVLTGWTARVPSLPSRRARTVNRPSIVFHSIARCPGGSISREISRHRKIPEPRARFFFLARGSVRPVGRLDPPSPFRDRPAPGRPHGTPASLGRARAHPSHRHHLRPPRAPALRPLPSPIAQDAVAPRPGDARTTWVAREQSSPHTSPPRRRIESSTPTFARAHSPHDETRASSNPRRPPPGRSTRACRDGGGGGARASQAPSERASTGGYAWSPSETIANAHPANTSRRMRVRAPSSSSS